MGIKLNEHNYRKDITLAFVLYAFLIVSSIMILISFYWTKINISEFQQKVLISSKNINYIFHQKELLSKKAGEAILNETILKQFQANIYVLENIFKTFLIANDDFVKISIKGDKNLTCYKNETIICDNINLPLVKLKLITNIKKENSTITIVSNLENFLDSISSDIFNLILIDSNGEILYSNSIKAKSIFDIFTQNIANEILHKNNSFITNDIYVSRLNDYKLVYIQNKQLLKAQKGIATKIGIAIFIVSFLIAIPFGYFFSTPLSEFYEKLNKRVKEELDKNREKEQLLMHQSKLAALGEMLGNIAHQWRHPITRLSLLVQNLKMAYDMNKLDDKYIQKFSSQALDQINYMSATIDDFTNFFKKDKEKQNFKVQLVIDEALKLLEGRIKNIQIIKEYKNDIDIFGYKTEFSQVILNILNNAVDVLNERNVKNKKIIIRIYDKTIEIEDNGGGVDEEIKDKIFEPYFTTKFQSQGTGIGLYMSKVIITKHFNSKLEVFNSKNGAIFKIALF